MNKYLNPFAVAAACIILLLIAGVAPANAFDVGAFADSVKEQVLGPEAKWHFPKGKDNCTLHVRVNECSELGNVQNIPPNSLELVMAPDCGGGRLGIEYGGENRQILIGLGDAIQAGPLGFWKNDKQKLDTIVTGAISVAEDVCDAFNAGPPSKFILAHEESAAKPSFTTDKGKSPKVVANFANTDGEEVIATIRNWTPPPAPPEGTRQDQEDLTDDELADAVK